MSDTTQLEDIFMLINNMSETDRKTMIAECMRKYGIEWGVWEITLRDRNAVLFINNRDNSHGFRFTKEGEFSIL